MAENGEPTSPLIPEIKYKMFVKRPNDVYKSVYDKNVFIFQVKVIYKENKLIPVM
jgi:hypothetical protein